MTMPDVSGFPCQWAYQEPECCAGWADADQAAKDRALLAASWFLWAASARRFGACETTVAPCRLNCPCTGGSCHADRSGLGWTPTLIAGKWYNSPCGCGSCRCCAPCETYLPGPVADVLAVCVDGVLVPESSYRVDDYRFLVRDDGACWPSCQDYGAPIRPPVLDESPADSPAESPVEPCGPAGWTVTYLKGDPVPFPGQVATGDLACELLKTCDHGSACDCTSPLLMDKLRSLTRDGVSLQFDADTVAGLTGQTTGLASVDSWVRAVNPYGVTEPARIVSPDAPRPRRVTWP